MPPGAYVWHAPQVHDLPGGPVSAAGNQLLRDFAIRAIEAQPFGYARSVTKGLALAVTWPRQDYPSSGTASNYYFGTRPKRIPGQQSWIPGGTADQDAARYGRASPSTVVEPFAYLVIAWQRGFYTYGPLFGVILLIGLGGVVRIVAR